MIPAVILAGGRASRMGGGDKGLVPFGRGCLLDAVIARLAPQAAPLALNALGEPVRFARFGLPVLDDPRAGQPGPLAGILAAMEWATTLGAAQVLTVPTDAPFLPPDLVVRLQRREDARPDTSGFAPPAIAATLGGDVHPVVGLWPAALAPMVRAALDRDMRRVRDFARTAGAVIVTFPAGPPDPFLNVNTPDDVRAAEAWL